MRYLCLLISCMMLAACAGSPPKQQNDLCQIFDEKDDWYDDAKEAEERWGSPIAVNMAIMQQESSFRSDAKPPRTTILWIFPGPRLSSAYGYPQAKDDTWDWYKDKSGNWGADRDDFDDAIDFIAWYNSLSRRKNGIRANDAYSLYLAYHEGHGGFQRGTYKSKSWLKKVAGKVASRAKNYQRQLASCEKELQSGGWFF